MTQQSAQYQILTLNQISSSGLKRFPDGAYEIGNDVKKPDARGRVSTTSRWTR
jgi:hypothetical protein